MKFLDMLRATYRGMTHKAISHRPDLEGREHLFSTYGGAEQTEVIDGFASAARVYESYVWVRKAVHLWASAVSPLPVRVVTSDGKPLDNHVLSLLFARGNDQQPPSALHYAYTVHMLLGGEGPIEIVDDRRGQPVELWSRRPDRIGVIPDASPERRLYPRALAYRYTEDKDVTIDIPPTGMIFDAFYNPLNPYRGLAPIAAIRSGITIDLFAQAWAKAFLARGARPDYALIAPQGITQSEREELEARLSWRHSGPDNWHRPIVLEQGIADIKPFSFAPKDLEWLEQRRFSREEVGAVFDVPDEMMGFGRDTYENFASAERVFWLAVKRFVERRDVVLTTFFTKTRPLLRAGERIATDLASVGVLQEDKTPKIAQAEKLWAMGVPFNTLDQQLGLGIGPVPGGEVGYLPGGLRRADMEPSPTAPPSDTPPLPREERAMKRMAAPQIKRIRSDDVDALVTDDLIERARTLADEARDG